MSLLDSFKDAPEALRNALSDQKTVEAITAYVEAQKSPLVGKNAELLAEKNDLKSFLDGVGGRDTVKTLHQAKLDAEAREKERLIASDDVEKVRAHLNGEIKSRDDRIAAMRDKSLKSATKAQIEAAMGEAGADTNLLGPHVNARLKASLTDQDDVVLTVLTKDGQPWLIGNEAKPAGLKDLLDEMKKDDSFAKGFAAVGAKGSGVNGGHLTQGVVNPWAKESLNLTKQMKLYRSNPELAKALAAQAGVKL